MEALMDLWDRVFWVPFAAFAAFLLYRWFKFRGLRGMLYGSPVARTIGELELAQAAGDVTILRVQVLEDGRIVIEYSTREALGAAVGGTPLSTADADRLITLLQQARSG
jgi:hypothetical protein